MKKITIFAAAILLLSACKKEISSDAVHPAGPEGKANVQNLATSRPIKLNLTSSVDPSSPALTCTMPGVPFGIANSGYFLHGNATHLGQINAQTSMGQDGFCNLSGTTFILTTATGGQIVAANGDKITYTGDDAIDLNNIIFNAGTTAAITGLWTITGGTGRFAGASGSFQINGIVDVTTPGGPTFSITGEGNITY
jgi:hypothetical protein